MQIPIDIPPGLKSDDNTYTVAPAWFDASNIRFRLGRPQTIGGWESVISTTLTGVCRNVFAWTENSSALNIAFGTHSALQLWQGGALYTITPYGPVTPLSANPFSVTNASATVTVTHTSHGYTTGASLAISGAADTGGIVAANLNGTRTITVTGTDTYTFTAGANATSTTTGGGSAVVVVPQSALPAGAEHGTGSAGYGTGAYGVGTWGTASTADYFPRTWSLQAWGQKLLASPRDGGLYEWSNNTATRALAVTTAPARITQMLVSPQRQVFALGCTQADGTYNPLCIRHSSIADNTVWSIDNTSASTAREYVLPGGGRIVGGRFLGKYLLVWTTHNLFLGTYVGQVAQVWKFDKVGDKCGLIGPNAAAVLGGTAYWISPDLQFHSYPLGGGVTPIACPIRSDFADNVTASQGDKITATSIAKYDEIRWDYPDSRDGFENSRWLSLPVQGPDAGSWTRGKPMEGVTSARTAIFDAGPASHPVGVTSGGNIYWEERGASADGAALPWMIQSADVYLDENFTVMVRSAWPDIASDQVGPVTFSLASRFYPQGDQTAWTEQTLQPSQDKVDLRATGRLFQITYEGYSAPSYARIGRLVVDAVQMGRR